jgi:acyl carrier protein
MDDAGTMLPAGQVGEVVVQGPNIMGGYEDDPEANQAAFRHGWFHTGDLGCLDPEGDLFLKGRVREMINRGGEKICPQEIDDLLAEHPAVAQAAAFPIPHRVLGEDCALAVVLRREGSLGVEEIRDYLAARLSAYKIPHLIQIVETLPRGPTGKVSRRLLSEGSSLAREAPYAPPRSELECRLAGIWAAELQVARVGLDDNFFLLGGDSLSGVRLLATVEEELGRALPVRALINLATIRSMAEALGVEDAVPDAPAGGGTSGRGLPESGRRKILRVLGSTGIPLVSPNHAVLSLHAAGSRPPLFWCFNSPEKEMRQLGGQLGADQPLYGLYSGGNLFDYTDEIHDQFAAMYVDELLGLLPPGPYYLGGNCRGASVAAYMAVRLAERGRTPEALCLMEDFAPILYEYPGRMLLLYGRQSTMRAQRRFRWGWPGWRASFRREPEVDWLTGRHARFFESGNVEVLGSRLELFFRGATPRPAASRRLADALLRAVHEFYPLFLLYVTLGRWRTNAGGGRGPRVL